MRICGNVAQCDLSSFSSTIFILLASGRIQNNLFMCCSRYFWSRIFLTMFRRVYVNQLLYSRTYFYVSMIYDRFFYDLYIKPFHWYFYAAKTTILFMRCHGILAEPVRSTKVFTTSKRVSTNCHYWNSWPSLIFSYKMIKFPISV